MDPAITSMTSVKDVRAMERSIVSRIVSGFATASAAFTDPTAWRISLKRAPAPARSVRTEYAIVRVAKVTFT